MSQRTASIDPFQTGFLQGAEERLNYSARYSGLPYLGVTQLVCSTLLQAGVHELEIAAPDEQRLPAAGALAPRIRRGSAIEATLSGLVLDSAFRRHYPGGMVHGDHKPEVYGIFYFLNSLFAALHRGTSTIWLRDFPDILHVQQHLPAELAVPVINLLQQMQNVGSTVVASELAFREKDVALAQELLNTAAYDAYVGAHATLDDALYPAEKARRVVSQAADDLQARNSRILQTKQLPVWLLSASAKIVDAVAGHVPGTIMEVLADAVSRRTADGRRVVVYNCSETIEAIEQSRAGEVRRRKERTGAQGPDSLP
jgi:hypothetical protein